MPDDRNQGNPIPVKAFCRHGELDCILFEEAADGMFLVDLQWNHLAVNPQFCRITGYSQEELLGMPYTDLGAPGEFALNPIPLEDLCQGNTVIKVRSFQQKDGSLLTVQIRSRMLPDGNILGIVRDISDLKRAEEELKKSENLYRAIFEHTGAATIIIAPDTTILLANAGWEKLTGLPLAEQEGQLSWTFFAHQEDLERMRQYHYSRRQNPALAPHVYEFRLIDACGSMHYCFAHVGIIPGTKNSVASIIDFTGRKKAEDALQAAYEQLAMAEEELRARYEEMKIQQEKTRESEEKYRKIFENIQECYYRTDTEGNLLLASPSGAAILGYPPSTETAGMNLAATLYVNPDDRKTFLAEIDRTGAVTNYEIQLRKRDGTPITVITSSQKYFDAAGNFLGIEGIFRDITERKKAEAALAAEKKFSDTIIDSIPGIFYVLDEKGFFVRCNKNEQDITGYTAEELRRMHALETIAEEDREKVAAAIREVYDKGYATLAALALTRDGRKIPFLLTGFSTVIEDRTYLVGTGIDITEMRKLEEAQDQLQAQLLQAQKMESVGRLAGGVAHDFNNMLGVIVGYAEIALHQTDPAGPLHKILEKILNAASRSANLTRQLLAFARKQTIAPKVLDLNETVESMLAMLQRLIGEDINLAWLPADGLWPVLIDPSQVDQILANLCVNARDAIPGVGKVTIETKNITFDAAYCAIHAGFVPGDYAMLAVSDNGLGMDSETLGKIFEPFFTTKGLGKGTGLGLSMVYGIVKQNHGFINAYSEPGTGTSIRIYLPRQNTEPVAGKRGAAPARNTLGDETILVVEDDREMLEICRRMLEEMGYRVLTACTGNEAIRQMKDSVIAIDLLIIDVIMPDMNGHDLAKLLLTAKPGMKCLFTSGYTANAIAHHGVLDEGVNFIQKPFSKNDFGRKIRQILDEG
jgi:PAS domain S-box-containing protein